MYKSEGVFFMYRKGIFIILMLIFIPFLLFSQNNQQDDDSNDPSVESDWDLYDMDTYMPGDQTFMISIGTLFPTVFLNNGKTIDHNFVPPIGGSGSLSYNYFITSNIFIGGEINGMFIGTLGRNTVFFIPLGLRAGYQFNVWRFDIPLNVTLGMIWHRYLNESYYGLYMKGGAAIYFRFNPDWSFGMSSAWCWMPQWTSDPNKNVDGNFVELTLSARYHF